MKIIFINFQSGMCMVKGHMQYITSGWKYICPHNSIALKNVIEFINEQNPDIVSFAEIDDVSWRSKNINQVEIISRSTHLKYFKFFQTRKVGRLINQGNAIISRYNMSNMEQIRLPGRGEKRYLCKANIHHNSQKLTFYTTHLSTTKKYNKQQRYYIVEKIKLTKSPVVLTGDFNIGVKEMGIIKQHTHLMDLEFQKTFPAWKPKMRLDHIFVSKDCEISSIVTYEDILFSDHIPIGIECII